MPNDGGAAANTTSQAANSLDLPPPSTTFISIWNRASLYPHSVPTPNLPHLNTFPLALIQSLQEKRGTTDKNILRRRQNLFGFVSPFRSSLWPFDMFFKTLNPSFTSCNLRYFAKLLKVFVKADCGKETFQVAKMPKSAGGCI